MAFPNINTFPESHPGPYEQQMGQYIVRLLHLFDGRMPDPESHAHVLELASTPERWSAAHAVFNELRQRLLAASKSNDESRERQYCFEESCCQAIYNATVPPDPFDPSSAFFVMAEALDMAKAFGIPLDAIAAATRL